MKPSDIIHCKDFPCLDIDKEAHAAPPVEIDPRKIKIVMISEAPPSDPKDYFYSSGEPFYLKTTLQAFGDAGADVSNMADILALGVYITTAIKCAKMRYSITTGTIKTCSYLLEKEMALFPSASVFLLMGDVAIKSMNYIAARRDGKKVIPAGSTYKIRKHQFYQDDKRFFPSYLQTGGNYLIEKSKRRMIAEDLMQAIEIGH
jgi:uracil-DNA glycosylase